jgi:outer membrane protein OmpA-like peptidoglycan-associated protein
MKKLTSFSFAFLMLLGTMFTSCDAVKNSNSAQKGTGIGVVLGGVLGAVIGNNIGGGGNGALGAAIGAAIGGGTGAIIGHQMDKQARKISEVLPGASVERVGEGIKLVLGENSVRFNVSKATLTPQAQANLDKLVPVFNEYSKTNINIYGYTDSSGNADSNLILSQQRADAVKNYLATKGIAANRFVVNGLGIADPIAANDTKENKALNRRVEFAITANAAMVDDAKTEAGK